jgi:hypothetical protein
MTEHSAEWKQAVKAIQSAFSDNQRFKIANDFFTAHPNEVYALRDQLGAENVRMIDVHARIAGATASMSQVDIASIIVASAMLEKQGVSNPTNGQILANAEAFAPNACGCHTTQTKFSPGLGS